MNKTLGLLCLFVVIPILVYAGFGSPTPVRHGYGEGDTIYYETPSINIVSDTNLTAAQCRNTLITNYGWNVTAEGDVDHKLPTAESGLDVMFLNLITHESADYYIDVDDDDQGILDGTACGDGERMWTENITAYESIHCYTFPVNATAYDWACDSVNGVWADKGS